MDLARLAGWLRCPLCQQTLAPAPPLALRCPSGHSFDANRRGYVSLLAPGTRVVGDSAGMLASRAAFLARGHYQPIVDALQDALHLDADAAQGGGALPSAFPVAGPRIVDAGCGTGWYLHAMLRAAPGARGLAADLAPPAVAAAVRGRADVDGIVADTWAALPLRDGVVDVVLDVFAPRNLPEFHRVLAPEGRVAIVAAGPDHLAQLRAAGRAVGIQEGKRERILEAADALFTLESERRVTRLLDLSAVDVDLLIGMGPSAHHQEPGAASVVDETAVRQEVTLDVTVHILRRRDVATT